MEKLGSFVFSLAFACAMSIPGIAQAYPEIQLKHIDQTSLSETEVTGLVKKASNYVFNLLGENIEEWHQIQITFDEAHGYSGFIDEANKIHLNTQLSALELQLVLAHELTHMIRHRYITSDELWIEEGFGKLIEYLYSGVWPKNYDLQLRNMDSFLISNDLKLYNPNGRGYVTSFYLLDYLYRHLGGISFLRAFIHSKETGWKNIILSAKALKASHIIGLPDQLLTVEALTANFAVALLINDPFVAKYGMFLIDREYEPLISYRDSIILSGRLTPSKGNRNFEIAYSLGQVVRSSASQPGSYSIESLQPFKVLTGSDPKASFKQGRIQIFGETEGQ